MPLNGWVHQDFVAIDFETATPERNSACAVALVKVQVQGIVHRAFRLIRPPTSKFCFTHIHGITWADVCHEPTFREIWPELVQLAEGAAFFAAHNAAFDRSVLHACCQTYKLTIPQTPFLCTMRLARRCWRLYPTKLPDVCRYLGIDLKHHDAASDAEACARIVLAARSHAA